MTSSLSFFFRSSTISKVCTLTKPHLHYRVFSNTMSVEAFKKNEIVPDVVSKIPQKVVKVSFDSGVSVNMGNKLTPRQVKNLPKVEFDADPQGLYTLAMTDPDAPSRTDPKFREWEHWLVVNIPGNNISKGDTLAEYVGSGPPSGTGFHRYVYLVYKQQGKITDKEHGLLKNTSGAGRGGFKIEQFANKHKLEGPIAGNFYEAEWDDYVPELYKQLGG
uniref:Phosphatidylethanolamine-binding protein n=1 Tax=Parastrongyloides trichosuri TaxID=131310 RepID=A0A0N4Z6M9_PARTI